MSSTLSSSPLVCPATPSSNTYHHRISPTLEIDDETDKSAMQTPLATPQAQRRLYIDTAAINDETRKRKIRSPRRAMVITPPAKFQKTRDRFESVLDRPFIYWKQLDQVLQDSGLSLLDASWNDSSVRGKMIHHLIHFLELKVGLDLYMSECLLVPTLVLDQAWRALVLETDLYQTITYYIQDFHGKPRKTIPYSSLRSLEESPSTSRAELHDKLRRTQSLFQVYFMESMPESISLPESILYPRASSSSSSSSSNTQQWASSSKAPPAVFLLPRFTKNPTSYSMVDLQQPMLEDNYGFDDDEEELLGLNLIED